MATFEEKLNEFKNYLKENVPDWNTQFLNWADARGFGFGGGFFNEFPHTHTYETDLSWLISRMKWTLFRMDSVEARMKAVEDLLIDFINTMDIPQLIRDEVYRQFEELRDTGELQRILQQIFWDVFGFNNNFNWAGTSGGLLLEDVLILRNLDARPTLNGLICTIRFSYADGSIDIIGNGKDLNKWATKINNQISGTNNETFLEYAKRVKNIYKNSDTIEVYQTLYNYPLVSAVGGGNSPYYVNTSIGNVTYAQAYLYSVLTARNNSTTEEESCVIKVPFATGKRTGTALYEATSIIAF